MNIDRFSSDYLRRQALGYLHTNQRILNRLQAQLASGTNITQPSQDPVGTTRLMDVTAMQAADARFATNMTDSLKEIDTADAALQQLSDLLQRAKELAVLGANDTNSDTNRESLALEVDELINQAVQLGNTQIGGRYVFSGMRTDTPPFSRTGDVIAYNGSPANESWQRQVEISQGVTVTVNINGETLLGNDAAVGSVFNVLLGLRNDLQANNGPAVTARVDEVGDALINLQAQSATLGATMARLTRTTEQLEARKLALAKQYSDIQDVDLARVISDLTYQQQVYQASLSVNARVLQTGLLQYL
jgi:flagellar hook-associated protein 3 FlgL